MYQHYKGSYNLQEKKQKLKFLYLKKQKDNKHLYHYHLQCADQWPVHVELYTN